MKYDEPSIEMENSIDGIVTNLYRRVAEETDRIICEQIRKLGISFMDWKENGIKMDYPEDKSKLTMYFYKQTPILGVKISENMMGIEFEIPELKKKED